MMARRLFLLGFVAALLAAFGCSSGGGGNGSTPPQFSCTAGGGAANTVSLACGGSTDGATEQIDVVLGGPASGTTTLRGLNFDLTYATANLEFVPGTYASALFPNALIVVSLLDGLPGRVVVSIQQPGGLPDVSVGAGSHDVLSLSFRRVSGVTFNPTELIFENSEATAASVPITFTSSLALSYQ